MLVKLMTYNVFKGFSDGGRIDHDRLDRARNVACSESPDLIAITEAYYGLPNESGIYLDYRHEFGFPFMAYAQKESGSYAGNCLLSRYPIMSSEPVPLDLRKSLRTGLDIAGTPLYIDVVHPHPFIPDQAKIDGIAALLMRMRRPYILTGDLNAISDEDAVDEGRLKAGFRRFTKMEGDAEAEVFLRSGLVPSIRSRGLRDAMPPSRRTHTIPTDYLSLNKDSAMRIDFCFVSADVRVADSYVVQTEDAEHGSDHRPIVTIIDI